MFFLFFLPEMRMRKVVLALKMLNGLRISAMIEGAEGGSGKEGEKGKEEAREARGQESRHGPELSAEETELAREIFAEVTLLFFLVGRVLLMVPKARSGR